MEEDLRVLLGVSLGANIIFMYNKISHINCFTYACAKVISGQVNTRCFGIGFFGIFITVLNILFLF